MIYGYCRISTKRQNIDRQVRNILSVYPKAKIVKETFTGTKFQGRKELDKILKKAKTGDTIVFDSVSRMSRTASEGFELYQTLYNKGINLVFLKEHYIDTDTYKQAVSNQLEMTGTDVDVILKGINEYLMILARKQIEIAFEQAEKEVQDLHQRTKEGIETARKNGKQIGQKKGATLTVKKAIYSKQIILKHNKTFGGSLSDAETQQMAQISRNSLYLYKRELKEETGLTIDVVKPAYTFTKIRKDYQTVGIGYLASTDDDHVSISFEHTDYKWCSIDELKDYLYDEIYQDIIYTLKEYTSI